MTIVHTISVQGTPEDPVIVEETTMTHHDEAAPRTRKKNPLVEYEKARTFADRARRAHDRAADLATKAYAALEKANELAARKDDAEVAEADALEALQNHLDALKNPLIEPDEYDEDGE